MKFIYLPKSALDILKEDGYDTEAKFYEIFESYINEGLVWADQDFKSYFHFYNPKNKRGMYGHSTNAMTLANSFIIKMHYIL